MPSCAFSQIACVLCLTQAQVRQYLTFVKTAVSSKGQTVSPAEFRRRLDSGRYSLVRRAVPRNVGVIKWLLEFPQKDFVPIDLESTDLL